MKRDDALRDYGVSVILGFIGLFVVLTSFGAHVGSKNREDPKEHLENSGL